MCLYTKQVEPKMAEKDIICYKFYRRYNEILISPYQEVTAPEIGIVTNTKLGESHKLEGNAFYIHKFYNSRRVDEGFHSFKILEEIKHKINGYRNLDLVIFKCIIPRGSSYYEGRFDIYKSYCSNSIKLIEVCV